MISIVTYLRCFFLLLAFGLATSAALHAENRPKQNLLIITADDMNADSGSWNGGMAGLTPNLDVLQERHTGL